MISTKRIELGHSREIDTLIFLEVHMRRCSATGDENKRAICVYLCYLWLIFRAADCETTCLAESFQEGVWSIYFLGLALVMSRVPGNDTA